MQCSQCNSVIWPLEPLFKVSDSQVSDRTVEKDGKLLSKGDKLWIWTCIPNTIYPRSQCEAISSLVICDWSLLLFKTLFMWLSQLFGRVLGGGHTDNGMGCASLLLLRGRVELTEIILCVEFSCNCQLHIKYNFQLNIRFCIKYTLCMELNITHG